MHSKRKTKSRVLFPSLAVVGALFLSSCTSSSPVVSSSASQGLDTLIIGTTDKLTSLDPAAAYDNGSIDVTSQIYRNLLLSSVTNEAPNPNAPAKISPVENDLATSAEFVNNTNYRVKIAPNLKFSNGHPLTASDVVFSFQRQLKINHPQGPASLLRNIKAVTAVDDLTVNFELKQPDATFPHILASPAGQVVDEEVFPADAVLLDEKIVSADPFSGPYKITKYTKNSLISFIANSNYSSSVLPSPKVKNLLLKYYTNSSNFKLDLQNGGVDVGLQKLTVSDLEDLQKSPNLKIHTGAGRSEIRYFVFNLDTQPFGRKTQNADPAKALAVRQAVAHIINREEIATEVYRNTYKPLYSQVHGGTQGATTPFRSLYGDGSGGPDVKKAREVLQAAGITEVVNLNLQYNADHYGSNSADEYTLIKSQLEDSKLFTVNLQTTEWGQYSKNYRQDAYPVFQLGWFADFPDASNFLTPFFYSDDRSFLGNHYKNEKMDAVLDAQGAELDPAKRIPLFAQAQLLAAQDAPIIPLLQSGYTVVAKNAIKGIDTSLHNSFKFMFSFLSKE